MCYLSNKVSSARIPPAMPFLIFTSKTYKPRAFTWCQERWFWNEMEIRSTNSASDTNGSFAFFLVGVVNDGSFLHPSSNSVSSHLTRLALDQIIITLVWMIIRFTQRHGWLQHLQTPVQRKSTFWFGGFHYEASFSLFSPKASWNHTEILKYVHFFLPYTLCYTWYKRELNCVCTLRNYKWLFFLILQTIFDSWFYDGV